jgi:hypothetical protein
MTAPLPIRLPPNHFPFVRDSPNKGHARTMTNATLSLSMGATFEAGPLANATKVAEPRQPGRSTHARRKPRLRRSSVAVCLCDPKVSAIAHASSKTTVVRIGVAKFGSTRVTPIFARRAVAAAKRAESKDHVTQVIIFPDSAKSCSARLKQALRQYLRVVLSCGCF